MKATKKATATKMFKVTIIRQMYPWDEPYETTRTIGAKDWYVACEWAEGYAEECTRVINCQGGSGRMVVNRTTIKSVEEVF